MIMRVIGLVSLILLAALAGAQRAVYQGTASVEIVRAEDIRDLQVRARLLPLPAFGFRQTYTFRDLPAFNLRIS